MERGHPFFKVSLHEGKDKMDFCENLRYNLMGIVELMLLKINIRHIVIADYNIDI